MKNNYIHYLIIIDESGSMAAFKDETVISLNNEFKIIREEQTKYPNQKYLVSVITFSDKIKYLYWKTPIEEVANVESKDYNPNGYTALLDAIGFPVKLLTEQAGEDISNGNATVLVSIMTDGQENSSKEFKKEQISEMIKTLQKDNRWAFSFIGCDEDSISDARSFGIAAGNIASFTAGDVKTAYKARQKMSSNYGATMAFFNSSSYEGTLQDLNLGNLTADIKEEDKKDTVGTNSTK